MSRSPSKQLEPDSLSVAELMGSFYQVPMYQREFSWEEDQLKRFWEDLLLCLNQDRKSGAAPAIGHFFGAVFVIGEKVSDSEGGRHRLIDGQQRVTTITCLSRVLLESVQEHSDPGTRMQLTAKLLSCVLQNIGGNVAPRIVLNREDDFYRKTVVVCGSSAARATYWDSQDTETPAVRARIRAAVEFFERQTTNYLNGLGAVGSPARDAGVEDLVYTLCDHFYVLKMRVEDNRMAYRLFETLNERGLDLSQADLVRNSVLERAERAGPHKLESAITDWNDFLDQVDEQDPAKINVAEMIQFSYSSRHESVSSRQKSVQAEKLFDEISLQLKQQTLEPDILAQELALDSSQWNRFLKGNQAYWDDQVRDSAFAILGPLWKKHAVPLLLRIAERFDRKDRKEQLKKALWATECYLFREGTIVGASLTELEKVFGEAARTLGDEAKSEDAFVQTLVSASPDARFREHFEKASAKGARAFYVAWRIERYLRAVKGKGLDFTPAKQSPSQHLEHILPRRPDSSWGGIEKGEGFDIYVNRLGNHLVLPRGINSFVRNKSFLFKVSNNKNKDYTTSDLELPKEVVNKMGEWSPDGHWAFESIRKRQEFLAKEYATKVWRIEW